MIQQCTDQPLSRVVAPPAREILHRRGQSINGRSLKADPMFLCLSRQLVYPSQTTCWSNWGFLWKGERIMRILFEWMKIVIESKWNGMKIEKIIKVVDWTDRRMRTEISDPYLWLDVTICWENCGAVGRYGAGEWEPRSGSLPVTGRNLSPLNDEKVFIKCLA